MKKFIPLFLVLFCFGEIPDDILTDVLPKSPGQHLVVNNTILATVNGEKISVLDVKKRMDLIIASRHPNAKLSDDDKFYFYTQLWRRVLDSLIVAKLAEWHCCASMSNSDKPLEIPTHIVRKEFLDRFGVDYRKTLDRLDLSVKDGMRFAKNDLFMKQQQMLMHQKAQSRPKDAKKLYLSFLDKNPETDIFKYQIATLKPKKGTEEETKSPLERAKNLYATIKAKNRKLTDLAPEEGLFVSKVYEVEKHKMSAMHKKCLAGLKQGEVSTPQEVKDGAKLFYLIKKEAFHPPTFAEKYEDMQRSVYRSRIVKLDAKRTEELKKRYSYYALSDSELDVLEPFAMR